MKNINYKYVTLVLTFVLVVTYAWNWNTIFSNAKNTEMKMDSMNMENSKTSHMMKMSDGSMMKMDNSDMNMGNSTTNDMGSMTMNDMTEMMAGKTGKDLEKAFITGMIPHHQGAVEMAKLLLKDPTVNPELRRFANGIITAQESEIKMMNTWLKKY